MSCCPGEDEDKTPLVNTKRKSTSESTIGISNQILVHDDEREDSTKKKKPKKAKNVHFDVSKNSVFYFEDEAYKDTSGTDLSEIIPSSANASSILTKEMTLLSTVHSRARRELRDISKYDLKSAIKHGCKFRARTVNGERRWMFKYANFTFITDNTCTKEITSYREPVSIQPAQITKEMLQEHHNVKYTIQNSFELVATHSIIVIDQSGSMRTCDVHGFKSRSDAAYGTLALDFIAEQLYAKGDEIMIDAVTIIEMNDGGTILYDRVPLDWILFNNLLAQQKDCAPRSHGNYNPCLGLVNSIIIEDLARYSSQSIEEDDLPLYTVVFLSDGRPSDHLSHEASIRKQMITEISSKLGKKFALLCMGIGSRGTDFEELERMILIAKDNGASEESQFVHAGLSPAAISNAFSSFATSTTATRTRLLAGEESVKKVDKEFTMRERGIASYECPCTRFTKGIKCFQYDPKMGEYPWRQVSFLNPSAKFFEMEDHPFGKGAERLAYRFYEATIENGQWKRLGKVRVAKESRKIQKDDEGSKVKFHFHFCKVQSAAKDFAIEFNKVVKKTASLKPAEKGESKPPPITFLPCSVYEYVQSGYECGYLIEDYLNGKYIKFSNNDGSEKRRFDKFPTLSLQVGEVAIADFLHAFSHWVFYSTREKMIVCDLQGILDMEGYSPVFRLTDPAINTKTRKHQFGRTDIGLPGIQNFCRKHRCNKVCQGLGLPPIISKDSNHIFK
ncbi:hypothetical protein CTEN210_00669 [Chaetoceros tenuissimus]|uniref:Alpha-type protein kinase domain-containing protein n=1 Tax=Chaetoceros tenuissimus TaxID=426638 RepID=A0AAD3GZ15_9STRA|nr:hypothetical protein CTEN210_00669 [Chaetoceros tenuissimus]